MKKLLFLLLVIFACDTSHEICYKCLVITETTCPGDCGLTKRIEYRNTYPCEIDIQTYIQSKEKTTTRQVIDGIQGEITLTSVTTCECREIE